MKGKIINFYLKTVFIVRSGILGLVALMLVLANIPEVAYASSGWMPLYNKKPEIKEVHVLKSKASDILAKRIVNPVKTEILETKAANRSVVKTEKTVRSVAKNVSNVDPTTLGVVRTMTVTSTAYSSTVDQCDSTPCITADGYNVCAAGREDVVAANFLKFGTKIKIPELYGDKIFTVHDRMNPKFNNRIDLWKLSRDSAIKYGKRTIKIEILG